MKSSKFALWRLYWLNYKDRGIVLPIAIGLGLIAVLVGTIMLTRSFRDQTDVVARQLANKSESVAELGVTRYLDLINQIRAIASVGACFSKSWNSKTGQCQDTTDKPTELSWANVGNKTTNRLLTSLIDNVTNSAKVFRQNVTTVNDVDIPCPDTGRTKRITDFTNQSWQNITESAADGQFRLIDYQYNPDPTRANWGEGTLIVEGGIGQTSGTTNPTTATAGTGITRLRVTFPVEFQPPWGLWTQILPDASDKVEVNANVRDSLQETTTSGNQSRCGKATGINTFRTTYQKIPSNNWSYTITPRSNSNNLVSSFPSLPNAPQTVPANKADEPFLKIPNGNLTTLDLTNGLKRYATDGKTENPELKDSGNSIIINKQGETIGKLIVRKGTSAQIVLRGNLYLDDGSIVVEKGATLIIYVLVGGQIVMKGNSSLINDPDNTPNNFQIYLQGISSGVGTASWINIGDNAKIENVFIFAPKITLTQTGNSQITGTVWVFSWVGNTNAKFTQGKDPTLDSTLWIASTDRTSPAITQLQDISVPTVNNISSWRRCETDKEDCTPPSK